MTEVNSLLGNLTTFASLMAGVCIAVERVVEIIKGAVPPLSNPWTRYDQVRAATLQLIAAAIGAVVVSQMPDQLKNAMPPGLAMPLHWPTYAVLGLMASGGSGAWNHVLDILAALKTKQEVQANIGPKGANTPEAALRTTRVPSTETGGSALASKNAASSSSAALPSGVKAVEADLRLDGQRLSPSQPPATEVQAPVDFQTRGPTPSVEVEVPSTNPTTAVPSIATNGSPKLMDASSSAARIFPGRNISIGDMDAGTIKLIQERLEQVGCGPLAENGIFDQKTKEAVELYQIRSADHFGLPLKVDGVVGPLTWYSLFAMPGIPPTLRSSFTQETPSVNSATTPLLAATLEFAAGEVGVMENPLGSNRGPRVDEYLRSVGVDPTTGSYPWCAAFVYFCFQQVTNRLQINNPVIKTDGVLDHWNKAGLANIRRLDCQACMDNPLLVNPGMIFVIIHPSSTAGHTGLVEKVAGNFLTTIEGNTNDNGSREGIGVFRRNQRTIASINRGFICY